MRFFLSSAETTSYDHFISFV